MQLVHRIDNNRFIPVEQVTEIFLISLNEKQIKDNIEFYERQLEQLKPEIEYLESNQKTFEQALNTELVEKTKKELKLKDRTWICPDCFIKHDRDINASINIKNFGLIKTLGDKGNAPSINKACVRN